MILWSSISTERIIARNKRGWRISSDLLAETSSGSAGACLIFHGEYVSCVRQIVIYMRKLSTLLVILLLLPIVSNAQVPVGERVSDIRYPVSGQRKLSPLSNDDVLYTILYFGYNTAPVDRQSVLDANPEYFALTFSDSLKPYFNNFNPDYGRALMIVSKMKGQVGIERRKWGFHLTRISFWWIRTTGSSLEMAYRHYAIQRYI